MREYILPRQSRYEDFEWRFKLADKAAWTADDQVVVALSPDDVSWNDYGFRRHPGDMPYMQITAPGDDRIALTGAGEVYVRIPGSSMAPMGPGMVTISMQHRSIASGSRRTFAVGRLPLHETGGV